MTVTLPGMDEIQVPLVVAEDVEKVGALGKVGSAIDYLVSGSSGDKPEEAPAKSDAK